MDMERAIKIVQGVGEFFSIISERRREEILDRLYEKDYFARAAILYMNPNPYTSLEDLQVLSGKRHFSEATDSTLLAISRIAKQLEKATSLRGK